MGPDVTPQQSQWSVEGGDANGTIDQRGTYTAPIVVNQPRTVIVHARINGQLDLTAMVNLILRGDKEGVLYVNQPLTAKAGTPFNLDINLAPDPRTSGYAALQFHTAFPQSVLQPAIADPAHPVEITFPDNVIPNASVSVNVIQPGSIRVAVAGPRNSLKQGTLVRIPMLLKGNVTPGTRIPVNIIDVQAFNELNQRVQILPLSGFVTVEDSLSCGDVDLNTHVEVADAVMALRAVVGLTTLTADQKRVADTNHDGQVTAGDVVKILRIVIGLDETCTPISDPRV
jgi:hypothetical protein